MKLVLGLVTAFAVLVTGTLAYNKSSDKSSPTVSESVAKTNSLGGNIVDELKAEEKAAPSSGKKVVRKEADPKRVVRFNTDFNYYSVREAVATLKELDKPPYAPIWLLEDSPGGSVVDGQTLNAQIESSKSPVYTVCTRLCASMAAMMHSYGHKRYALDGAILMYHPASGGAQGQIKNMLSLIKTIDRYVEKMNNNVITRANGKLTKDEFDKLVAYEIWIDAEDALEKGLIDEIVSLDVNNSDLSLPSESDSSSEEESEEDTTNPAREVDIQMIYPHSDINLKWPFMSKTKITKRKQK